MALFGQAFAVHMEWPASTVVSPSAAAVAPVKVGKCADPVLLKPLVLSLANFIPGASEARLVVPYPLTLAPVYSETTGGVTLNAANLSTERIGFGVRDFNPDRHAAGCASRVGVEEGKQYVIRRHLTLKAGCLTVNRVEIRSTSLVPD